MSQHDHSYLFDVKLFASISVRAASEGEARRVLKESLDGASCNAGAWPDGDPILFEASLDDGSEDLVEVDGEAE